MNLIQAFDALKSARRLDDGSVDRAKAMLATVNTLQAEIQVELRNRLAQQNLDRSDTEKLFEFEQAKKLLGYESNL